MVALLILGSLLTPSAHAAPTVSAGYHGDMLSHPGGFVGLSWDVADSGPFSVSLGTDLGAYHHERNHTGAFARAHLATRVTSAGGWLVEPRFSAGYLHTWVDSDEYWAVDERSGVLRQTSPSGSPNVFVGWGLGVGHTFNEGPTVLIRPEILGRTPYNDFTLSQFALQAAVEWPIGGSR